MNTRESLFEAAIRFDEGALEQSGDAGAAHFLGVMRLDPRHLGRDSPLAAQLPTEIEIDGGSTLFLLGDVLGTAVDGRVDHALEALDTLSASSDVERLLLLLVAAWLDTTADRLATVDTLLNRSSSLPKETVAWSYVKIATWALDELGIAASQRYYDLALSASDGDLHKALLQIGETFGRDARLFLPSPTSESVQLPRVARRASDALASFTIGKTRKSLTPFARTFGGDPSTLPVEFRSAEMQAGWTGALWLLDRIWRLKASLLLQDSRDPIERADGIIAWAVSDGSNLRRLVEENEYIFTAEIADRVLVDRLQSGRRIGSAQWVQVCSALWDELPTAVSDSLISGGPGRATVVTEESSSQESAPAALFAALSLVDTKRWVTRFESLGSAERRAVATAMNRRSAAVLPVEVKAEITTLLLDLCSDSAYSAIATQESLLTLASLAADATEDADVAVRFQQVIPRRFAASIAVAYPEFTRRELIIEERLQLETQIRSQIEQNREGRWAKFGVDASMSVAQACIALRDAPPETVDLLVEYANAQFTATDDVLGAAHALSWLFDENLLTKAYRAGREILAYRSNLSPVDRYWSGRDDLRAANAAIAGFHARILHFDRDAVERLIIAARDPDMQVRLLALQEFVRMPRPLVVRAPALDAMVLGAVYDPQSRVQAVAIDVIDLIADDSVYRLAWERVLSAWSASHRRVRLSAARAAARGRGLREESVLDDVLALARADRSLLVRETARVDE
ncbi:hypothetical protein [Mycobacterium marinum]|uniref:hypothetical protein n=1 Tax=Mycobacterium marinum TaxID=1781 RepID=UPI00235971AC|nr:hypothetical protein [Mycobacterium marinum]MDC9005235.1 hypothetical protein [Mycobacterium marinum]